MDLSNQIIQMYAFIQNYFQQNPPRFNDRTWSKQPLYPVDAPRRSMLELPRDTNREFGSVFRSADDWGPRTVDGNLPSWEDPARPGNTASIESAKEIIAKWPLDVRKRFRIFMDSFKDRDDYGPWVREWLEKSAPGYDKDREQIIKCKLELIKRILHMKVRGPESMEDFCLLFLTHDHHFDIPRDVETLLRPPGAEMDSYSHWKGSIDGRRIPAWFVTPSDHNAKYPSAIKFQGLLDNDRTHMLRRRKLNHPWYYMFRATEERALDRENELIDRKLGHWRPNPDRTSRRLRELTTDPIQQFAVGENQLRPAGFVDANFCVTNASNRSKYPQFVHGDSR